MSSVLDTTCYANSGSLQAFSSSLTTQQRDDVLQSTLLAQILADEKYKREDERWHKEYFGILGALGWSISGESEFQQYTPSGIFFSIDKVVIDLMKCSGLQDDVKMIENLFSKFRSLRLKDKRLQLFHESTFQNNAIVLQFLSATANDLESVSVSMTGFNIQGTQQWMNKVAKMNTSICSFLFAHHPTLLMTLTYETQNTMKLTESEYKSHRHYVVETLKTKCVPFYNALLGPCSFQ